MSYGITSHKDGILGPDERQACPKADLVKAFDNYAKGFHDGYGEAIEKCTQAAQLFDGRAANAIRALAVPAQPDSEASSDVEYAIANIVNAFVNIIQIGHPESRDAATEALKNITPLRAVLTTRPEIEKLRSQLGKAREALEEIYSIDSLVTEDIRDLGPCAEIATAALFALSDDLGKTNPDEGLPNSQRCARHSRPSFCVRNIK